MGRARLLLVVMLGSLAGLCAYLLGACAVFGSDDATGADPADGASSDESSSRSEAAVPSDASDDGAAVVCVPETPWAEPNGSVPRYATCDGKAGVDLFGSASSCGRCGHSCGDDPCVQGRCAIKLEVQGMDPGALYVLGTINTDVYYANGYYLLSAFGATGNHRTVEDLSTFYGDAQDQSYKFILGGITQRPAVGKLDPHTYVRTRAKLFSLASMTLTQIAEIPDNDENPGHVAATTDSVFVVGGSELVRVATSAGNTVSAQSVATTRYVSAHDDTVYWLEQPWNVSASGDAGSTEPTVVKKRVGNDTTLIHSHPKPLTAMLVGAEGLYFMELGAGGGILRLPFDAAIDTVPTRIASDDALTEQTPWITTDATFVYWMATRIDPANGNLGAALWKRAKCGGAQVHLGDVAFAHGLAERGTRLYFGSDHALESIAK